MNHGDVTYAVVWLVGLVLASVFYLKAIIMSSYDNLKSACDAAVAKINEQSAQIVTLTATVADLQGKIASATTDAQLDALTGELNDAVSPPPPPISAPAPALDAPPAS